MNTIRKYVMTDEVWDMLMEALEARISYIEHASYEPEDVKDAEIAEMHRLIDTVEIREERYHPESTMAILDEDEEVLA